MSIKPILFNTEMVRAILDGRKTVTRRVLRGEAQQVASDYVRRYSEDLNTSELIVHWWVDTPLEHYALYRPGDVLWVRETWAQRLRGNYLYRAAPHGFGTPEQQDEAMRRLGIKWRPSIHMPREAARIWLRVMDVRVERLQEIDEDGAQAEGLCAGWSSAPKSSKSCSARQAFMWLWDSTIKPADRERYGWATNPLVWVIHFERCEMPEGEK